MSGLPIDLEPRLDSLPEMARGLLINILLTFITLAIGLFTSLLVTLARMSRNRLVSGLAGLYVVFFRGAPLLILLYLVYYGFGQIAGAARRPVVADLRQRLRLRDHRSGSESYRLHG